MTARRYRILKKLGEGGSGRTYLVRDRKLGKLWAMKEWKEGDGAGEELRILRELDSPFFPRIVESFQEDGKQYLLMDWIRGTTLEETLKKEGPLPWRTAAEYAAQICMALERLHGGCPAILHLDLKPSNIILTQDGPRLIDFGSAAAADQAGKALPEGRIRTGTPGYAAPELYGNGGADVRSDVYGLGALLWVMLTGKRNGRRTAENVPERLREIAEKALAEKKEDRFETAGKLRQALEELLSETAETKRAGKKGKHRALQAAKAVCAAAVCLLAAVLLLSWAPPRGAASAGKTEAGAGKRAAAVWKESVWELIRKEEEGKFLGLWHDLGEAFRGAAGQRGNLSKEADGSEGKDAGF